MHGCAKARQCTSRRYSINTLLSCELLKASLARFNRPASTYNLINLKCDSKLALLALPSGYFYLSDCRLVKALILDLAVSVAMAATISVP